MRQPSPASRVPISIAVEPLALPECPFLHRTPGFSGLCKYEVYGTVTIKSTHAWFEPSNPVPPDVRQPPERPGASVSFIHKTGRLVARVPFSLDDPRRRPRQRIIRGVSLGSAPVPKRGRKSPELVGSWHYWPKKEVRLRVRFHPLVVHDRAHTLCLARPREFGTKKLGILPGCRFRGSGNRVRIAFRRPGDHPKPGSPNGWRLTVARVGSGRARCGSPGRDRRHARKG
jgi:hypothetical protein